MKDTDLVKPYFLEYPHGSDIAFIHIGKYTDDICCCPITS